MNKDLTNFTINNTPCPMIFVQGGSFDMGGHEFDREKPIHQVTVPSLYIGQYPVTQKIYSEIMGENPSLYKGSARPVERVSWNDTQIFLRKLYGKTGMAFRLPSEAEWEFAARGGIHAEGHAYSGSDDLKQVGWYDENSGNETKPVGLLLPNELGLYDMSGNVREWCEDQWHGSYENAPADGSAWLDSDDKGADRVIRGGRYFYYAVDCRPAYRNSWHPGYRSSSVGFRVVFPLQSVG